MENNGILKSFELQDNLNPKIWEKTSKESYILSPKVREKLLEIAYEFIESLKVDVIVSDVHLTGSLVNFNWSQYSDFDLHIIADFNQFPKKSLPLYEELFKLKKTIFNSEQNIKIYGYDVEVFVQDENEKGHSAGIFSLISNDWLEKPKKEKFEVNKSVLKKKIDQWTEKIDKVLESAEEEKDLQKSKKIIDNLKTKLKEYRKIGLEKGGEMSYENLVFKYLRRSGHIEKLFSFKKERRDKELSLKERLSINESTITLGGKFKTDLDNGPKNHQSRALGNWQSDNAWDVFAPAGTNVNSYTNGKVYKVYDTGKNSGKVYGTQVTVTGDKGFPNIFYTHLKNVRLRAGDKVQVGDNIGEISEWIGNKGGEHVHIGLPYGNHLRSLLVNSNKIFTSDGSPIVTPDFSSSEDGITNGNSKVLDELLENADKSAFLIKLKELADSEKQLSNQSGKGGRIPYDEDVERMQIGLQFLGHSLPVWGIDGLFGPETENAVKSFQKDSNLDETGVMGGDDLKYLYATLVIKGFEEADLSKINFKGGYDDNILDVSPDAVSADFETMTKIIVDNIEGGYYNPDWHAKAAMGRSGETMFGMDRVYGSGLFKSGAGKKFWETIDKNKNKDVWKHYYRGGSLEPELLRLVTEIMSKHYQILSDRYLSDKAKTLVQSNNGLKLHFYYASWNGEGFFKRFAENINQAVGDGIESPEKLLSIAINSRLNMPIMKKSGEKLLKIFKSNNIA